MSCCALSVKTFSGPCKESLFLPVAAGIVVVACTDEIPFSDCELGANFAGLWISLFCGTGVHLRPMWLIIAFSLDEFVEELG